jgi:hypothetical protein
MAGTTVTWHRWLFAGLVMASLIAVQSSANACSLPAPVEIDVVTRALAGEELDSRFYPELPPVVAVVEWSTVRVWDATRDHTAASASVVTRYWGSPLRDYHGA